MGLSNELSCEAGSFSPLHNPHRFLPPEILRLYFPALESLGCTVCLTPQLFFPVICMQMWDFPVHQPLPFPVHQLPPCHMSSLSWLPVSTPPICLNECFFFNSLVVGLPYSLILWQFWLFFVFKFDVLLVVLGNKVYLSMPPSWPELSWYHF